MDKEKIEQFLRRIVRLELEARAIKEESDNMFCGYHKMDDEVFLNDKYFEHISEVLQATVTYDSTVYNDGRTVVGYFFYEAYGIKWKMFALLDATNRGWHLW